MSIRNITNAKRILDPRGVYIQKHTLETLVTSMGFLPKCIDLKDETSFLSQVQRATQTIDMSACKQEPTFDIDIDGSFVCLNEEISRNGEACATGIIEREVDNRREAIYFYANGMVIVEDYNQLNDQAEFYCLRLSN